MIRNINGSGPAVGQGVVQSAAAGVQQAWDEIVDTYAGVVWAVPRRQGLSKQDAAHVSQLTWMRLSDRLNDIAPESIGGWLERTAERECARVVGLSLVGQEEQAQPA